MVDYHSPFIGTAHYIQQSHELANRAVRIIKQAHMNDSVQNDCKLS